MFNVIIHDDEEYKTISKSIRSFSTMDMICDICGSKREDGFIDIMEIPGKCWSIECNFCGNTFKIFTVFMDSEAGEYINTLVSHQCVGCFYSFPENNNDVVCKGEHCNNTVIHPNDCKCCRCIEILSNDDLLI